MILIIKLFIRLNLFTNRLGLQAMKLSSWQIKRAIKTRERPYFGEGEGMMLGAGAIDECLFTINILIITIFSALL